MKKQTNLKRKQLGNIEIEDPTIMDFSDIDFASVGTNSKNVYLYFSNRVVFDFEDVENLKEKQFKNYAKKHNRSIDEILALYDAGFKEGIMIVENSIIERSKISSEAGKLYLFEIASVYNLGVEYYNKDINIHFREYCELAFDREIIKNIGRVIGKFYFSWVQVLENHRLFEPLFKSEIDRIKNSFPNKPIHSLLGHAWNDKNKFSFQETALIYVYEGKIIQREEGKIYQYFTYYSKRRNRIAIETTRKKTSNKIDRIEKIIPHLSASAQNTAFDEVSTLKAALEAETF